MKKTGGWSLPDTGAFTRVLTGLISLREENCPDEVLRDTLSQLPDETIRGVLVVYFAGRDEG